MRDIKNENDNRPGVEVFKKLGGGTLKINANGRQFVILPGQHFKALPEEISPAHRDQVVTAKGDFLPKSKTEGPAPKDVKELNYFVKKRENSNVWYDVVDAQGKQVNTKALRADQAEELVKSLKE